MWIKIYYIKLQTLQDNDMIPLLENNIRGGIGSVIGGRNAISTENKKNFYVDANNLSGQSMSQILLYDESSHVRSIKLEDILKTTDSIAIGYFVEVALLYDHNINEKQKTLPFDQRMKKLVLIILMIL